MTQPTEFYFWSIVSLLVVFLIYPPASYLKTGWSQKLDEINAALGQRAKQAYIRAFHKKEMTAQQAEHEFKRICLEWYARQHYALPMAILVAVAFLFVPLLAQEMISLAAGKKDRISPLVAALSGGYSFVVLDFLLRMQQKSFTPGDVLRGALRLVFSIPLGLAFAEVVSSRPAWVAFCVAAFPIGDVVRLVRQLITSVTGSDFRAIEAKDSIGNLFDVDGAVASRIADADITTIGQLAWSDPIRVSIRTKLAFNFVIDLNSQALARIYMGDEMKKLASLGLRGAYEIRCWYSDYEDDDLEIKKRAAQILTEASKVLGQSEIGTFNVFEQIARDPYTVFVDEAFN